MIIFFSLLGLIAIFYLLARISDLFFVESIEIMADKHGLESNVAGAVLMAIGSSAPEFFTALIALFIAGGGHENIGAGTIVGSALFNLLVIIGAASLFRKMHLTWQPITRDLLFYFLSVLFLFFFFLDGKITIYEGIIFVILYIAYLFSFKFWRRIFPYKEKPIDVEPILANKQSKYIQKIKKEIWYNPLYLLDRLIIFIFPSLKKNPSLYKRVFILSIGSIILLSWGMIKLGIIFATALNLPTVVVALTIFALGTSIPDLFASLIVAKRGKGNMAVANAVGSNIFDIQIGLGLTWLIAILIRGESIAVSNENIISSVILLFGSIIYLFIVLFSRKWTVGKYFGITFIATYLLYIFAVYNGWLS